MLEKYYRGLKSLLIILLGLSITMPLFAQDASTPEGQKSIEYRNRFYQGHPIRKFAAKTTSFTIEGQRFSNASPAIYDNKAYVGTDSGFIYAVTPSEIKELCTL